MAIEPYENETIDLWSLGFMFAVENIDPKVGRIEIQQVFYESGDEIVKRTEPLELVDCEQLFEGKGFNNKNFNLARLR